MVNLSPRLPIKSNAMGETTATPSTTESVDVKTNVNVSVTTTRRDIIDDDNGSNESEAMAL